MGFDTLEINLVFDLISRTGPFLPSSAQLNPTPTSVGWAEIAFISTFTHPPPHPRESTELSSAQLNPTSTQLLVLK